MVVGNHTLSASTSDQNFLRGSSDEVQVLVMRNTDLTIQNLVGFRNSTALVSGHLRDTGGEGLSGLQLDLYFDDFGFGC